jgi:dTDP-4-amino-4,6-dideoxyglucose formyltransferase
MKKIAVFSDNPRMASIFKSIINRKGIEVATYFYCSIFSRESDFIDMSVEKLDIKKNYTFLIQEFDLIISMHCKQIFPKELVENVRCINIHPGYNPTNRGWYSQVFSIIHSIETGATIHEMDAEVDHGAIIARKKVPTHSWDTSLSLYNKIVEAELELIENNIVAVIENSYSITIPENEGNTYWKRDFNTLCELDLDKKATYKEVINHLRAVTHGEFNNAYFIDKETNKKVFVKIILEQEK